MDGRLPTSVCLQLRSGEAVRRPPPRRPRLPTPDGRPVAYVRLPTSVCLQLRSGEAVRRPPPRRPRLRTPDGRPVAYVRLPTSVCLQLRSEEAVRRPPPPGGLEVVGELEAAQQHNLAATLAQRGNLGLRIPLSWIGVVVADDFAELLVGGVAKIHYHNRRRLFFRVGYDAETAYQWTSLCRRSAAFAMTHRWDQ